MLFNACYSLVIGLSLVANEGLVVCFDLGRLRMRGCLCVLVWFRCDLRDSLCVLVW